MLGILRDGNGKAIQILNNLSVDLDHLRKKVEILSPATPSVETNLEEKPSFNKTGRTRVENHFFRSKSIQSSSVSTAHLLLCILRNENDPTTKLLNKLKIDYDVAKEQYINMTPNEEEFLENLPKAADSYNDDSGQDDSLKEGNFNNPTNLIKIQNTCLR
jgi:ATP-dependent Clp protease ATP-binding subunit ClpC